MLNGSVVRSLWVQEVKPSVEDTYRIRKGSSTFYLENDESSQIFEGLLFKKGAMIRNWKQRWFVLDATSGEVRLLNIQGMFSKQHSNYAYYCS